MIHKLGLWIVVPGLALAAVAALAIAGPIWAGCGACGATPAAGTAVCSKCSYAKGSADCHQACSAAAKVKQAGLRFVTASELSEQIKSGQPPIIVNVLSAESYTSGRIKGSVNIPLGEVETLAPKVIPDKTAEIVVYCGGYKCGASIAAGTALKNLGYTNVADYKGGIQEWTKQGLPVEGASATTSGKGA